jgi:hypothetical protein
MLFQENYRVMCIDCVPLKRYAPNSLVLCAVITNVTSANRATKRTLHTWVITMHFSNATTMHPEQNLGQGVFLPVVLTTSPCHTSLPIASGSLIITIKLKLHVSRGLLLVLNSRPVNKVIYFAKVYYHSSFQYPEAGGLLQSSRWDHVIVTDGRKLEPMALGCSAVACCTS